MSLKDIAKISVFVILLLLGGFIMATSAGSLINEEKRGFLKFSARLFGGALIVFLALWQAGLLD